MQKLNLRQSTLILQSSSKNRLFFKKTTGQPKDPKVATRAPCRKALEVHKKNSKNNSSADTIQKFEANAKFTTNVGGTEEILY